MRYLTSSIAAFMLVGTAALFAQQQTPTPPSASRPPDAASSQAQPPTATAAPKSTLTGCVMQAKTTDGGTAYVLNKAEGGSATMYVLGSSSQQDWTTNVNKKVEVIGPVQEPPAAARDTAANPKVLRPPLVVVESVRVVSESCQ